MSRYRAKPHEIEAVKWDGTNLEEVKQFVGDKLDQYTYSKNGESIMKINTIFGIMEVKIGDYIIKYKINFVTCIYICKSFVFENEYEELTNIDEMKEELENSKIKQIVNSFKSTHPNNMFCKLFEKNNKNKM